LGRRKQYTFVLHVAEWKYFHAGMVDDGIKQKKKVVVPTPGIP
jgi:hypothetical protein